MDTSDGFYCIPNNIIKQHGAELGPYGIAVYNVLVMYANRKGECWPSYQTIADLTGMSRKQAQREIAKLESLGIISKTERQINNKPASNVYALNRDTQSTIRDTQSTTIGTDSPLLGTHSPSNNTKEQDPIEQNPREETARERHRNSSGSTLLFQPNKIGADGRIPRGEGTTPVEIWMESHSMSDTPLSYGVMEILMDDIKDLSLWRSVCEGAMMRGWKPRNMESRLDKYRQGGFGNETHQRHRTFGIADPNRPEYDPTHGASAEEIAEVERWVAERRSGVHVPYL